ncbi:MAG: LytTR family transcriptional regulator [Sphingobacteriaceae bacterium]|nr:MAG: LytTR family transcriptional regulator [Sphingobacteriaceae bacterium]
MQLFIKWEHLFREIEYPARYTTRNLGKTGGILFGVLFAFLMLYRPFGVYEPELKFDYSLICFFHALSPTLLVISYFSLLNYYKSVRRRPQEWTLFQEYYQLSIMLFLIGIASFLMRDFIYKNPNNWSLRYFWEEIRNCYLVGILFYFYLLLAYFYFMSKAGVELPLQVSPVVPKRIVKVINVPELFIHTQVKQDNFCFNPNELLFVKADGNYVELTINKNGQLITELKRISLRQLESKLSEHPFLFRCHRAYLVNMMQIENVSGNSQGYLISFQQLTGKVPVSRMQLNKFDTLYKQIHGAYSS